MKEERARNWDWTIPRNASGSFSLDAAQLAVLMDIREGIQAMLHILRCPNFQRMPRDLRQVRRNTTKPTRRRAAARKRKGAR